MKQSPFNEPISALDAATSALELAILAFDASIPGLGMALSTSGTEFPAIPAIAELV